MSLEEYDLHFALLGIRHADQLWRHTFYGVSSEEIMEAIREFLSNHRDTEPLFYHLMSNVTTIEHLFEIVTEFINFLKADRIIVHMIDGWEDFFIKTNYTLLENRETEYENLEHCRQHVRRTILFLINHLGEEHTINAFYKRRLFELFFIRIE